MQITVLGGAGGMGSRAVKDIAGQKDVTKVIIGDLDFNAAQKYAEELNEAMGTEKVEPVYVDANHAATVAKAISGSTAVASAIGPYYKFGHMVVENALEAGASIVDICDDYDAVEDILSLDKKAKSKGVTVLTGMGWTPGLSNMLAVKGINELDDTREVYIYWAGSPLGDSGMAVILHTLHIFSGNIPTFKDGKLENIPAGSEPEKVNFFDMPRCTMYHVGHPEPVTMGRFLPNLDKVVLKGGLTEDSLNKFLLGLNKSGLSEIKGNKDRIGKIVKKLTPLLNTLKQAKGETRSAIKVEIKGTKDGKETLITYEANADMADLTGIPLAIGTLMLAREQTGKSGVYPPEAIIDSNEFLSELENRNIRTHRTT